MTSNSMHLEPVLEAPPRFGVPGAAGTSVVVLKTRNGKIKTTPQTLAECDCENFDGFLRGDWTPSVDKKGRPKLRFDFDDRVFRHTLVRMQTGTSSVPPSFDGALIEEQQRQLRFLCHRPTLAAQDAALDVEHIAALQTEVTAVATPICSARFERIEAGTFTMGSPVRETRRSTDESQCLVELTRPFFLQSTPVTQGQWEALMGNNPSSYHRDGPDGELASERPVERVSWWDAVAYCNRLSESHALEPYYDLRGSVGTPGSGDFVAPLCLNPGGCAGFRLPTKAEQEYSCRAGTTGRTYPYEGDDYIAWYDGNSCDRTHPVGQMMPNAWGLFDTLGNVSEWSGDWKAPNPVLGGASDKLVDPQSPYAGSYRHCSGSSYTSKIDDIRAAYARLGEPSDRGCTLGFRLARSIF